MLVEPLIGCQFSELFSVSWDRVWLWLRGRNCFRWWSGSLAAGIGELRESSDELDFERLDKPRLWSLFLTQFSLSFSGVQASIFQSYHLKMCNWRMNKKSGLDSQYQPLILDFWPSSAAVTSLADSEIKCWKWVSYEKVCLWGGYTCLPMTSRYLCAVDYWKITSGPMNAMSLWQG